MNRGPGARESIYNSTEIRRKLISFADNFFIYILLRVQGYNTVVNLRYTHKCVTYLEVGK